MATPAQQMFQAVADGNAAQVATLLDSDTQLANLTDHSPERLCVLYHAAERGDLSIVELLLEAGANVDKRSHDGSTALHAAAASGHIEVVRRLVEAGAIVKVRCNGSVTPLLAAHRARHRAVADYLKGLKTD